jgi:septal ring factor EnvC (AmiA/AmiB activator)
VTIVKLPPPPYAELAAALEECGRENARLRQNVVDIARQRNEALAKQDDASDRIRLLTTDLHAESDRLAATTAALQSLRERVKGLPWTVDQSYRASTDEVRLQASEVSRAAVIALIEEALEP